jgi:hypothetical protein
MKNWYIDHSKIHGKGVFSNKIFLPDTFIDIAIDDKQEITDPFGSMINHSFNPSCVLIHNIRMNTYDIYSLKEIMVGDEITANYYHTPHFIAKPMPNWK